MKWGGIGKEQPTELEPLWIECPACNKQGCGECNNRGRFKLTEPPRRAVKYWAWSVLMLAERYKKGTPPVAGGALDQTNWITEACDFVDAEKQAHMGEHGALGLLLG